MPRRDRTGPQGKGPRTGRGLGSCLDEDKLRPQRGFPKELVDTMGQTDMGTKKGIERAKKLV